MDPSSTLTSIDNPNRLESYQPEKIIGRGSTSVVYLATCTRGRLHGRKVAIKAFTVSHNMYALETSPKPVTQSFHHPALISLHSSFTVSGFHYLVLELCEGGSLCKLINTPLSKGQRGPSSTFSLTEAQLRPIIRRIAEGVAHLHSHDIIHGDIRPHNVFITGDGRTKLGGFGPLTLDLKSDRNPEILHTILCKKDDYNAPEIATDRQCSFASDLWSIGLLIVTFLTGTCQLEYTESDGSYKFPASVKLSPQAQDLANGLLKIDPRYRTPLKKVLAHAFLDPSLPNQSLMNALVYLKDKNACLDHSRNVESETIETRGGPAPLAIPDLCDRDKQDSKNRISSVPSIDRIPSSSVSTSASTSTAAVKTTQHRHKTSSRPRLYSTSSVLVSSGIQDAWRRLSSRQQVENDSPPHRSKPLTVAEATESAPGPLKMTRKVLGEVGNLRRSGTSGLRIERVPGYIHRSKEQPVLASGLLSPPETHIDQPLLDEGGLCDAASISSSLSASSVERHTWQRSRHFRQNDILTAPSTSPYEHPIPIPRISSPKGLQVAPLFPQTHKIAHGQLVILPSLNLLVDLREGDRRAGGRGDRILCVSPDGQEIKIYEAPHLSTPVILSEPREMWTLKELPERYWESYTFASKYIESIKKRTPWMVWCTPQGKFTVMSNGPKGDIHLSFPCPPHGLKEQRYVSGDRSESFVKMKIKFSRQHDTLELSRYAPSHKQRGRGEWISKFETITVERLKLGSDFMLNMTTEERQGLVCLIEGVKLAEAAEEIYRVARPHIEEKDSTLDNITDRPLKPDGTGRTAATALKPQRPEATAISDTKTSDQRPYWRNQKVPFPTPYDKLEKGHQRLVSELQCLVGQENQR